MSTDSTALTTSRRFPVLGPGLRERVGTNPYIIRILRFEVPWGVVYNESAENGMKLWRAARPRGSIDER